MLKNHTKRAGLPISVAIKNNNLRNAHRSRTENRRRVLYYFFTKLSTAFAYIKIINHTGSASCHSLAVACC